MHDGSDFLQYAAAKTVLDNLIHRLDVAEIVVAFVHPRDRLVEYANSTGARPVRHAASCVPRLEAELPLVGQRPAGACSARASARSRRCRAAYRAPDTYGSLALMSGSFVFTDIAAADHGGGPVFDPVVQVRQPLPRPARVVSPTASSSAAASTSR